MRVLLIYLRSEECGAFSCGYPFETLSLINSNCSLAILVQLREQKFAQTFGLEYTRVCGLVILMPFTFTLVYCSSIEK